MILNYMPTSYCLNNNMADLEQIKAPAATREYFMESDSLK